jgi:hypothetical protein
VTRSGYENIRKSINLFVTNSGGNQTHPNGQEHVAETEMHDKGYGSTSWKHVVDTEMEIVAPRDSACMACSSSREGEEVLNHPEKINRRWKTKIWASYWLLKNFHFFIGQ